MRPLVHRGTVYPDIPDTARILHARGSTALPAAGAQADLDGNAPTAGIGGTDYLAGRDLALQSLSSPARVRVIACGVALRSCYAPLVGAQAIAAAGSALITTTFWTLPARYLDANVRGLWARTAANTQTLDIRGAPIPLLTTAINSWDRVGLLSTDAVRNGGGAPQTTYVGGTLDTPLLAEDVTVRLTRVRYDRSSLLAINASLIDGGAFPLHPDIVERGELPTRPIVHPACRLDAGEAFGVRVSLAADSPLKTTTRVDALCILAVWLPEEER